MDIDGLLNDYNRGMAAYLSELEFDAGQFEQIQERLNLINHLKAKYGNTVEEIQEYQARARKS